MMRLPALARSAALSLRPGPNPLAFPGLVVAAVALGFAVLTAPEVVRAQRDWRDGVGVVVVVDRPRKAIKVIPAAGQRRHRRRDHCRGGGADVGPIDDARVEGLRRRLSALAYSTQASRS